MPLLTLHITLFIHAIGVVTIIVYLTITSSQVFCEQARVNTAPLAWSPFSKVL